MCICAICSRMMYAAQCLAYKKLPQKMCISHTWKYIQIFSLKAKMCRVSHTHTHVYSTWYTYCTYRKDEFIRLLSLLTSLPSSSPSTAVADETSIIMPFCQFCFCCCTYKYVECNGVYFYEAQHTIIPSTNIFLTLYSSI